MVSPDHLEGIKKQASHEACFLFEPALKLFFTENFLTGRRIAVAIQIQ
jgi:hypothetical protein